MVLKMSHLWFSMELRVLSDIGTQGDSGEKSSMWPHYRWHGRDCTPLIEVVHAQPPELPRADPAVVERRADQDRRGAGVSESDHLFDPGDPASDGEHRPADPSGESGPSGPRAQAAAGSHPREIEQEDLAHAAGDAPRASSQGSSDAQTARGGHDRPPVEQVEAEDRLDPRRPGLRFRRARADRARSRGRRRSCKIEPLEVEQRGRRSDVAHSGINDEVNT